MTQLIYTIGIIPGAVIRETLPEAQQTRRIMEQSTGNLQAIRRWVEVVGPGLPEQRNAGLTYDNGFNAGYAAAMVAVANKHKRKGK